MEQTPSFPADWAIERAMQSAIVMNLNRKHSLWTVERVKLYKNHAWSKVVQDFARYIEAHEEPPVDPLLVRARELAARIDEIHNYLEDDQAYYQKIREGYYDKNKLVSSLYKLLNNGEIK